MVDRILLMGGHVLSIDPQVTVIVGGKVHQRDGKLTGDWGSARKRVQASSDYLREALARKQAEAPAS